MTESEDQDLRIKVIRESVTNLLEQLNANCQDAVNALIEIICIQAVGWNAPIDVVVESLRLMYKHYSENYVRKE